MANRIMLDQVIDYIDSMIFRNGWTGKFYIDFLPYRNEWQAVYKIQYKYLSILDFHFFPSVEFNHFDSSRHTLERLFNILREYEFQFHAYFNGLWC